MWILTGLTFGAMVAVWVWSLPTMLQSEQGRVSLVSEVLFDTVDEDELTIKLEAVKEELSKTKTNLSEQEPTNTDTITLTPEQLSALRAQLETQLPK